MKINIRGIAAVVREVRKLGGTITRVKRDTAIELAEKLPPKFRSAVRMRLYPYADNSPVTIARKHSEVPLVETKAYINSWRSQVTSRRAGLGTAFSVVMAPVGIHPTARIPNAQLGLVLEHGSSTSPARPHIGPFMGDAQEFANNLIRKRVRDALRR